MIVTITISIIFLLIAVACYELPASPVESHRYIKFRYNGLPV